MQVGVNMVGATTSCSWDDDRYLRTVVSTIRQVQPEVRLLLFTEASAQPSLDGWDCVPVDGLSHLERAAKREKVDLLFTPLSCALPKCGLPQVLLVSNLAEAETALAGRRRDAARVKAIRRTCVDAAALVAPSRFVQRECLDLLEIPLDKIVVAPPGTDPVFDKPQPCFVQQPYLLTVAGAEGFSDVARLRKALSALEDKMPHSLVVVGPAEGGEPEEWGPRVLRIYDCPQAQLAALHQHCGLFVYVPFRDGVGLAVLEAMRAGAPIVTSRVGAIPEVAGDVPLYANPNSVGSIVAGIWRLLEEGLEGRDRRIRFGRQMAAKYTWENCAWRTVTAFRHACR